MPNLSDYGSPQMANQDGQPPKPYGGETFIARQRRLKGQQNAQLANPPGGPQGGPQPGGQAMPVYHPSAPTAATPVSGDGKIPAPQPGGMALPGMSGGSAGPQRMEAPTSNITLGGGMENLPQVAPQGGGADKLPTPPSGPMTTGGMEAVRPPASGPMRALPPAGQPPATNPQDFNGYTPIQMTGQTPEAYAGDVLSKTPQSTYAPTQFDVGTPDAYRPDQLSASYRPTTFNTDTPQGFTAGALPSQYRADKFSQFAAPDQSRLSGGQEDLAAAILGHPESMSPDVVNALKNSNKEEAAMQARQAAMRNASGAAARGVVGGGAAAANDRRIFADADSRILQGNRSLDVQAAQTNQADRLNSLSAVDQVLNSQLGRATQGYSATLAGQSAQAGANLNEANSGLDVARLDSSNRQAEADSRLNLANFGLNKEKLNADDVYRGAGMDLSRQTAQAGINQAGADSQFRNAQFNLDKAKTQADEGYRGFQSQVSSQQANAERERQQAIINQAVSQSRLATSAEDRARQGQQADENFRGYSSGEAAKQSNWQKTLDQLNQGRADKSLDLNNRQFDWQKNIDQQSQGRADRSLDLQGELGRGGLAMDSRRLDSANSQFDKNYGLNILQYLEGQRQANNNLGFNYSQLNQSGQKSLMDTIMGLFG